MSYVRVEDVCKFLGLPMPRGGVLSEEQKRVMQKAWAKRMEELGVSQ